MAEALSLRISDILEYAEFKEEFANQIGKYNVGTLEDIRDLYLYDFGVFIEVTPDEEEKAQLEQNIQIALSSGGINLEDAIDIREVRNIKLANQLLKTKRAKKQEDDRNFEMQKQQMVSQQQLQSQQLAAQTAQQKIQLEGEMKMREKQAEVAFDIEKLRAEAELKSQLMEKEFNFNMSLKGIDVSALKNREQMKEDAKADRISKQNSQQSKLIEQRQKGLPPISFESEEDTLDGFSLDGFSPR